MPYIDPEKRSYLECMMIDILADSLEVGELNFVITKLCHQYIDRKVERYDVYNDVIGVLECAKLELFARLVRPYEDKKILQNGDL